MKIRYLLTILLLILLVGSVAALDGYNYKKTATIAGSPARPNINYPVKIIVHRTTGTDAGPDVYIGTKCRADYGDIRFTTSEDLLLDYWIESSSPSAAVVWVEVTAIPITGTLINLFYGNATIPTASNGPSTFTLFDDFPGSSLDTGKWTSSWTSPGGVSVSDSIVTISRTGGMDASIQTLATYDTGYAFRSRMKTKHFQQTAFREQLNWSGSAGFATVRFAYTDSTGQKFRTTSGPPYFPIYSAPLTGWTADQYHTIELARNAASSVICTVDNTSQLTSTLYQPTGAGPVQYAASFSDGSLVAADWALVRKFVSPEPSAASWSAEQPATSPVAAFSANTTAGFPSLTVRFTDQTTHIPTSWYWTFGDGATSNLRNPVHTFTAPGTYLVQLTATNAAGSSSAIRYIRVFQAGYLQAWGTNDDGRCNVFGANEFVDISGGGFHSLALRSNGSLAASGWGGWGQCNVPAGNDFVAIAAGYCHSFALRSNGSLAAWGEGDDGQCNVPAGNDFVAIAVGTRHCLALRSNGSLAAWGWNYFGQCNVPAGNDIVAIEGGQGNHNLALRSNGSLAAWGDNASGQCNVPAGNDFVAIAAGNSHSLALRSDGSLVAWGANDDGQCNVPAGNDYIAIAAGSMHSLALRSNGSLVAWGLNQYGQCNVPAGNDLIAVAAGGAHSLALRTSPGLPLKQGWNFVSTPRTLADGYNTASTVFGQVDTGGHLIWRYDGGEAQWHAMNNMDRVETLEAYWVYSTRVGPSIYYRYSTDMAGRTPREKYFEPGWNAFGMASASRMPTEQYLVTITNEWNMIIPWNTTTQMYNPPQVDGFNSEQHWLDPMQGYWIHMKDWGEIIEISG